MAALTRSGARKASEIVMLIFRVLHCSRLPMLSGLAVGSAMSSSSQRRPRAIDATNLARVSERIGRACSGRIPSGRRISRRRLADVFCQDTSKRWPATAWHGRCSPHRPASRMVPAAPGARPSWTIIAHTHSNRVSIGCGLRVRKANFCGRDKGAENRFSEINPICRDKGARIRNPATSGTSLARKSP